MKSWEQADSPVSRLRETSLLFKLGNKTVWTLWTPTYFSKASFSNCPQDLEVVEVHYRKGKTEKFYKPLKKNYTWDVVLNIFLLIMKTFTHQMCFFFLANNKKKIVFHQQQWLLLKLIICVPQQQPLLETTASPILKSTYGKVSLIITGGWVRVSQSKRCPVQHVS